ncbi:MAG: PepSY-associated TM helix domain-containing protein [Bacteroidales bacterium]
MWRDDLILPAGLFSLTYEIMKIKWRKINRAVHRDLGYFFVAMCIIYGLSGIALNHLDDWNPNYIIHSQEFSIATERYGSDIGKAEVMEILSGAELEDSYKDYEHFPSSGRLKIFIEGGSITVDMKGGTGRIETIQRRPVFYEVNFMHYNPGKVWMWFSDIFSASLIILSISGMFILRGKKGIKGRGAVLVSAGVVITLILIFLYI